MGGGGNQTRALCVLCVLCARSGPACEAEVPTGVSVLGCSGQGRLRASFCHCNATHWGQDCTRSTAWAPDPANALELADAAFNRTAVRIYRSAIAPLPCACGEWRVCAKLLVVA